MATRGVSVQDYQEPAVQDGVSAEAEQISHDSWLSKLLRFGKRDPGPLFRYVMPSNENMELKATDDLKDMSTAGCRKRQPQLHAAVGLARRNQPFVPKVEHNHGVQADRVLQAILKRDRTAIANRTVHL
ncbi:hypothetical protein E4U55_005771 [Claviceps digitariae]|nr:hypothetical protein E4U55_005771 [Claviceps digitariae]